MGANDQSNLNLMMDTIPDALVLIHPAGTIEFCNQEVMRLVGEREKTALTGASLFDLIAPEDVSQLKKALARAAETDGRVEFFETFIIARSGRRRTIELHGQWYKNQFGEPRFAASLRPIESRHDAQVFQCESQRELELVTDHIPILLARISAEQFVLMINQSLADWVGRPKSELIHTYIWEVLGEPLYHGLIPYIQRVLAGEKQNYETHYRSEERGLRYLMITLVPQVGEDAEVPSYVLMIEDISERKKTELNLQIREAEYRSIVEGQTELICRFLPDTTITFVNDAYCKFFNRSRDELIYHRFMDHWEAEDAERVQRAREQIAPETPCAGYETHFQKRCVVWTESGLFTEKGLVGYQAVGRDVTEKRAIEEALLQSEARLRLMVSNIPVVLFAVDRDFNFTLSEGKGLATIGLEPGEVVGLNALEIFKDLTGLREAFERALTGETFSQQTILEGIVFEVLYSPLSDAQKNIQGVLGMAVDITEKTIAEQALRDSEERYRSLVENQGEGAGIFDAHQRFEYINLAVEGILGLQANEIIGRNLSDFIPHEQHALLEDQAKIREGGSNSSYELPVLRPDGQRRTLLVTASPRFDRDGNFLGSFALMRDISDRKRLEEKLRFASTHDALTGLYNRAYYEEEIGRLSLSRRYPISVIVIDLDGLKLINDLHGHSAGDELLRRTADVLRQTFRGDDMVARIGGDEFVVLLPETEPQQVEESIARLLEQIQINNQRQLKMILSLSVGTATAENRTELEASIQQADMRMYENKRKKKAM